jgi:hypothetical protein
MCQHTGLNVFVVRMRKRWNWRNDTPSFSTIMCQHKGLKVFVCENAGIAEIHLLDQGWFVPGLYVTVLTADSDARV